MQMNNIRKTAIMLAIAQTIAIMGCGSNTANISNVDENKPVIEVHTNDDYEIFVPNGFHLVGGSKLVKNPSGLVGASFVSEPGYHLEQYDYDDTLFYVIRDGFHNENGFLVQDGYHLYGNKIEEYSPDTSFSKTLK